LAYAVVVYGTRRPWGAFTQRTAFLGADPATAYQRYTAVARQRWAAGLLVHGVVMYRVDQCGMDPLFAWARHRRWWDRVLGR
jgi:hypothetical protein